jgi:hypothetical protein
MVWQLPIPGDAVVCGLLAVLFCLLAFRFRNRLAASSPAAAVFLVLLAVPVLIGLARLYRPVAGEPFFQAVLIEAYAMLLGMALPLAVVLVVMARHRRFWEIRRCRNDIEVMRGWKDPTAARRILALVRHMSHLGASGIDLSRCHLRQLNLSGVSLSGALLVGANLESANLSGSNLKGADLQGAGLHRAVMRWADLSGSVLWGADMREAVLVEAELGGALLREADLTGADLSGARLGQARGLTADQLGRVRTLHGSELPASLLSQIKARYPALLRFG